MNLSLIANVILLILFFIFKQNKDTNTPFIILLLTLTLYDIYMYLGVKQIKIV